MFMKYCLLSIPVAIIAGLSLLYFGSRLKPETSDYSHIDQAGRSVEVISYSKAIVKRCIDAQNSNQPEECDDLKEILEILQGALDLAAKESMAGSAFYLSKYGYWQYLATGWAVIFIMLVAGASYTLLFEVGSATRYTREILRVIRVSRETELQPYLNIVDVSVQTGEPPFGGGVGWIDITFKNSGKTPARSFCNCIIDDISPAERSQYVEMLDGTPVVHLVSSDIGQVKSDISADIVLMDLINAGERRTIRCPVVTDIPDRSMKQLYMESEWERFRDSTVLPKFEGYRISGSIEFSNVYLETTKRKLSFELSDSIDDGRIFKITEDKKVL